MFGIRLGRTREASVEIEPQASSMGGVYPGGFDSGHAWRTWHPTARLLAVVIGFLAVIILALSAVIVSLLPLKSVDPIFLTVAPETRFAIEASRLHDRADLVTELTASWVRRWVDFRFAVIPDGVSMGERVLWIKQHSAPQVWLEFERTQSKVNDAVKFGNRRDVMNLSVNRTGPDYWLAEFSLQDTRDGKTEPRGRYRIGVRTALVPPQEATRSQASREIDPGAYLFGFMVMLAQQSEVQ